MAEHTDLGNEGEEVAADYLLNNGYRILERNWRYNKKEIDIIAKGDGYLVIVEVKTRTSDGWENPRETITNGKIKFIVEAAEAFIMQNNLFDEVRFDVITVMPGIKGWQIEHIKEAFHPSL